MVRLRTVVRGNREYHYVVESYRWNGSVRRWEKYLGTVVPRHWEVQGRALEREVWGLTWFREFDSIRDGFQAHRRSLPDDVLHKEREQFVVEFTYDTNRIEGSRLTFHETAALLLDGISPRSRPISDVRESQLHAALVRRLLQHPEPVDIAHLLAWHAFVFGETKPRLAGRIREFEVRIAGSRHLPPPPLEVRPMLLELLRRTRGRAQGVHPVERAAQFHFEFENIHPFGDGNGRIGRLATNLLLQEDGFPMMNIRYGKRAGYYRALERSSVTDESRPFLLWFFRRYRTDRGRWANRTARSSGVSPGPSHKGG